MPAFRYDGEHGKGLLESALAAPQHTFEGQFLHRTIFAKAAALFRSVANNHGLIDGNKRLALATVAQFLTLNGYLFYVPRDEAVSFAVRVASTERGVPFEEISRWMRRHSIRSSAFLGMGLPGQLRWLGLTEGTEDLRRQRAQTLRHWIREINKATVKMAAEARQELATLQTKRRELRQQMRALRVEQRRAIKSRQL